ncbi:hypothetical protein V0R50_10370 [Pseudomonas sp. 148P]|uniref:Phage protein n=1 Tax=Pseudomonas ulcerans TaxID=3115852 RepID=A0ABU7HQ07_9PSED|nr:MULTISPECIES: hypothetical protein [unclassified Pseudomonas]MEE1922648.1 hypothetical protein [Pseudomonas sp. 147P]MEE1933625.1 hypothetical protein [Pseudomonas sp. 148P]
MPTENRSTEMISVPRELAEEVNEALLNHGHVVLTRGLQEALDVEQRQGEPVMWANAIGDTISSKVKAHNITLGGAPAKIAKHYVHPLYAHADAGEVERLRSIERVYDLREALLSQVKGERDRMIARTMELAAQLEERDALLRDLLDYDISPNARRRIEQELTSSAEPSAVECATCLDVGSQCMECEEAEFRELADRHFASADYRKTDAGVFIQDWMRHAYGAWCARGALDRKS